MRKGYRQTSITFIALTFFLLNNFVNHSILAQNSTLSGTIYDRSTGETLPYAAITVEGSSTGTTSDLNGEYALKLDSGSVSIRYHFLSFADTVITFEIVPGRNIEQDVYLAPDMLQMNEFTVSANRVARKVRQLAIIRNQQNENLRNYQADVHKLAILSSVNADENANNQNKEPVAFSERFSTIQYSNSPERYSEIIKAHRASENFFSEYDFFSTGGGPLNLNQDEVSISILSESITVVGPVSAKAGKFYDLYDEEADSTWPDGTIEISFKPLKQNRPLFEGKIWYDDEKSVILGIDVELNEYANTNTGTFQVSDFRYRQEYAENGDFWLPEKTELSATIGFLGSRENIFYHDEWSWSNFKINSSEMDVSEMKLSSSEITPGAHQKTDEYWEKIKANSSNENLEHLQKARNYEEDRVSVQLAMFAMRSLYRLPYALERSYLTNISDFYHYNRVEGHYLGLGLRTPVHPNYDYRIIGGYGMGNESFSYQLSGYHFAGDFFIAPEFILRKETLPQYQDYEYNRTPIDFFEARQTLNALFFGSDGSNYFEREGLEAGARFRFGVQSFLRVLYVNEKQNSLSSNTGYNVWGNEILPEKYVNNDINHPAEEGRLKGMHLRLHHDTRQYTRNQFLRDYNIRKFGWMSDVVLEKGLHAWGSDFDYTRYRLGLKFYWPVFTSHFFQTDITIGATDSGVPGQRMFSYNGFVVDDYVRYRPFNTISYRKPLGNRVSEIMIRYKLGTSLTRKAPLEFLSRSGIKLTTFFTVGVIDENPTLTPLLPHSGAHTQAEMGIAASKIFGFFYAEFSKRLYGDYGNSVGFTARF